MKIFLFILSLIGGWIYYPYYQAQELQGSLDNYRVAEIRGLVDIDGLSVSAQESLSTYQNYLHTRTTSGYKRPYSERSLAMLKHMKRNPIRGSSASGYVTRLYELTDLRGCILGDFKYSFFTSYDEITFYKEDFSFAFKFDWSRFRWILSDISVYRKF